MAAAGSPGLQWATRLVVILSVALLVVGAGLVIAVVRGRNPSVRYGETYALPASHRRRIVGATICIAFSLVGFVFTLVVIVSIA